MSFSLIASSLEFSIAISFCVTSDNALDLCSEAAVACGFGVTVPERSEALSSSPLTRGSECSIAFSFRSSCEGYCSFSSEGVASGVTKAEDPSSVVVVACETIEVRLPPCSDIPKTLLNPRAGRSARFLIGRAGLEDVESGQFVVIIPSIGCECRIAGSFRYTGQ